MSRAATIFIEYRDNQDSNWKLFSMNVSKDLIESRFWPDYDENTKKVFLLERQGIVRDILDDDYASFSRRDFPKDISDELKNYFEQIDLKYAWGKSYCSLSELELYIKTKISDLEKYIKQNESDFHYNKILQFCNKITKYIINGNTSFLPDETFFSSEEKPDYIEEYKCDLEDYQYALSFVEYIEHLIWDFTKFYGDEHFRLVYYIS
jgi:hypothetical protein